MERRKLLALVFLLFAIFLLVAAPVLAFTPFGARLLSSPSSLFAAPTPTPTAIPPTPTPSPTPLPILTVRGTPPPVAATTFYLIDMDTQHVLASQNSVKSLPMASTTKIMTALIAIESG